jgi:hypothetical protein
VIILVLKASPFFITFSSLISKFSFTTQFSWLTELDIIVSFFIIPIILAEEVFAYVYIKSIQEI